MAPKTKEKRDELLRQWLEEVANGEHPEVDWTDEGQQPEPETEGDDG